MMAHLAQILQIDTRLWFFHRNYNKIMIILRPKVFRDLCRRLGW